MRLNSGHPHRLNSIPESHLSCSRTQHRCAEDGEELAVREDIKGGATRQVEGKPEHHRLTGVGSCEHGPRLYSISGLALSEVLHAQQSRRSRTSPDRLKATTIARTCLASSGCCPRGVPSGTPPMAVAITET